MWPHDLGLFWGQDCGRAHGTLAVAVWWWRTYSGSQPPPQATEMGASGVLPPLALEAFVGSLPAVSRCPWLHPFPSPGPGSCDQARPLLKLIPAPPEGSRLFPPQLLLLWPGRLLQGPPPGCNQRLTLMPLTSLVCCLSPEPGAERPLSHQQKVPGCPLQRAPSA